MTALPAKEQVNFLFSIWSGSLIFDCSSFVNHEVFLMPPLPCQCFAMIIPKYLCVRQYLTTKIYTSRLNIQIYNLFVSFFFLRFSIGLWHLFYKCNIIEIDERLSIQWPVRHLRIFTTKLTPHLPQYLQVNIFTSH